MTSIFRLDRVEHRYWLDEEEMPSLTRIIAPLNDFGNVSPVVLSMRAQEGTDIHETIRLWLDGTLDESSLGEGNRIALDLFIEWYESFCSGKLLEYETPTYHRQLKYGTTPDLVFETAIVEIKTRKPILYRDSVQLTAQAKCFPEFPPKELGVLSIDIEGRKSTFQRAEHRQAWGVFRKLLDKYRSDQKIASLVENWKRQ